MVAGTVLSPAPWLFWLGLASPLFLTHWARGWEWGALFLVTLFATNIGSASALAWAASHGRRVLAPFWRRRMLTALGAALVLAGGYLVVQTARGNLSLVQPEFVEELLDATEMGS